LRHAAAHLRVSPPRVVDGRGRLHDATLAVDDCAYDTDARGPWGRAVVAPGAESCSVRVRWTTDAYPALVDPAWVATGSMATTRYGHTATLLGSGQVLVGGSGRRGLFDRAAGLCRDRRLMTARSYHTATLLGSGQVLVAGGYRRARSCSIKQQGFVATGVMAAARAHHSATLLGSGKC
jgi:hypothetical protein